MSSSQGAASARAGSDYRADIDGLRGVAVLSVILFHLSKLLIPGGFVGVDVFFVISGYLITSHILGDLDRGRFSLAEFYRKRIKRIAPAMLVVVAATLVAAALLMLPKDVVATAKSVVATLASLANVHFWRDLDTSYFAAQGEDVPLLHLWSLGVEEQFYILWPLVLMLIPRRQSPAFVAGMCVVAAISVALGDVLFTWDPAFVYYMLPTRAGELLIGAIAATELVRRRADALSGPVATTGAVLGLALVLGSLALLSEANVFPGIRALPPTIGAALLILTGSNRTRPIARLLSFRPLAAVGLVSYSAYLWHWPLVTFYRYGFGVIGLRSGAVLFALTMALAWLSYRFVEQPARRVDAPFGRVLVRQFLVPAGVIGVAALATFYGDRLFPSRTGSEYRREVLAMEEDSRPAYDYPYVCQRQRITPEDAADPRCVVGAPGSGEPSVLLWGDSNAAHYVGMVGTFAKDAGFAFRNVAVGACPPLLVDPARFVEAKRESDCLASLETIRPLLDRASVLIVAAAWDDYVRASDAFVPTFFETVRELTARGKHVVLIGKVPILAGFDVRCRQKALRFPLMDCAPVTGPLVPTVVSINAQLRDFAERTPDVEYFDANDYLCPAEVCSTHAPDGTLLYGDFRHLSLNGSWRLGATILDAEGVPGPFRAVAERAPRG